MLNVGFFVSHSLMGAGLAMDAFSVCLANGLHEPDMSLRRMSGMALLFALFQALMPLIGWVCVHTVVQCFRAFELFIPWIALVLLCFIGGKMIADSIKGETDQAPAVGLRGLLMQGVATSIDALSVGFTIAELTLPLAIAAVSLIGFVTFVICLAGLYMGRTVGTRMAGKAGIFGGILLILIGLEIFITGIL